MNNKYLILITAIILLSGCRANPFATRYYVSISSIAAENQPKAYYLLPGSKDINPNSLYYKEYSTYVHRSLKRNGFIQSETIDDAEVAIFITYGIGDPRNTQYSYSLPVYGQTGYSSSYSTFTTNIVGNTAYTTGTTTYTPTYGVVGYNNYSNNQTVYDRFIQLTGINLESYKKGKIEETFSTTLRSTGTTGDLRSVFPLILAGGLNYIGKNLPRLYNVSLNASHPNVKYITGKD